MRSTPVLLTLASLLALGVPAQADEQVPPVQDEIHEHYRLFPYSEAEIRKFVTTEFARSKLEVDTEQVIAILIRDLAKDGAGGFRIAPQDFDYTLEYHRVGPDVRVDKITR